MKTSGMFRVGAEGTRGNASSVMDDLSASRTAGRPSKAGGSSKHHYEWLHLVGRSLGGTMSRANLVAGSFHANTEMIPLENEIYKAAQAGHTMDVCVTAFCVAGTDIANRINYKVYKNDSKVFEKTFDANRGPVSDWENRALREAAQAALGDGWWGSIRRVIGPR
jgi:phage tail protein X